MIKDCELVGKRYGSIVVDNVVKEKEPYARILNCTCDCGEKIKVKYRPSIVEQKHFCQCTKRMYQKDSVGKKYSFLTVLDIDTTNTTNVIVACECGNTKSVQHSSLIRGDIKTCGCQSDKIKDVRGEKYNRFTIIDLLPSKKYGKSNYKQVLVKCECGNERSVCYRDLKKGKAKSCGCINKENKVDIEKEATYNNWTILKEIEPYITKTGKIRKVLARCLCGTEKEVLLNSLRTGDSKSCGCLPQKLRESQISINTPITPIDLESVNKRDFGEWTVIEEISAERNEKTEIVRTVKVQCSCGHIKETNLRNVKDSKSCSKCYYKKQKALISDLQREVRKKLEGVYGAMKNRCRNENSKDYKNYGGRGIKVEESFSTFTKFFDWAISNGYEVNKGLEIDREDNNGNYSSDNCRFVSKLENNRNMRRNVMNLEIVEKIRNGEWKDLSNGEVADIVGCNKSTVGDVRDFKTWKI